MATKLPLPLPGNPPRGFPPLRRPRVPPLCFPLQRTRRTGFLSVQTPPPLSFLPTPWRPPAPAASASSEVASKVAPPGSSSAPLPSDSPSVAVSILPASPAPPAISASSSNADSSVYSPLPLVLSSALSSVPLPPTRSFPPAKLCFLLTGGSSVFYLPPLVVVAVVSVASLVSRSAPIVTRVVPCPSLDIPPAPLPPYLLSFGLLWPPAPPLVPPPPAPAADISCMDKYVGNRTGRGDSCWSNPGGSAPHGKCPNSPLDMGGESISRPLLLQ